MVRYAEVIMQRGGRKMITIDRVDHMNMDVKDLDRTAGFYEDLFGFKTKEEGVRRGQRWRIIGVPGSLYLCLYETGRQVDGLKGGYADHMGIHLEDFPEAVQEIEEKGVPISYGDGVVETGASRSVYIEDPDGREIELSERFGGGLD